MKTLKTAAVAALLIFMQLHSTAQNSTPPLNQPDYNKPKLFSDLPDKLDLQANNLEALLNYAIGAQISTSIAKGFKLTGTVVSKSAPNVASVKSVVIKSSSRLGAVLTFARITGQDGNVSYKGRIMSQTAGDAFEIVKENNAYVLRKKGLYDLINE